MDDFLDRLGAALHQHAEALIKALSALAAAEASCGADAIAETRETVWQARLALAELAFGNALKERMAQAIAPLDNQGDDPATEHRRFLLGLGQLMLDVRSIGSETLSDLTAGDTRSLLSGKPGQVLRPAATGPGRKAFNEIELHLMRWCVLYVCVECARTDAENQEEFLKSLPRAPSYSAFRDWVQRVPAEQREMATEIRQALRADQPLSKTQQALRDEISGHTLAEIFGYLLKLKPDVSRRNL
jgi:hypothetical protein